MRLIVAAALSGLFLVCGASSPAHAQGWLDNLFGYYDHGRGGDPWDYRRDDRRYYGQYNRSYPPQHWHGSTPGSFQGPPVEHGQ